MTSREPVYNIPRGWKAESVSPSGYLTDEANNEFQWCVARTEAPYEGKDRMRTWFGPTLDAAFELAFQSLPKLRPPSVCIEEDKAALHSPNEALLALADRIDHEQLWRRPGLEHRDWPQEKRDRMRAGVELRRYADLLGQNCWRVYPPKAGISYRADSFEKLVETVARSLETDV